MWKYMPYANVVGRSRRSPATPGLIARRSASIWLGTASQECAPGRVQIRSTVFVDYVSARLVEDPHLWARTLLDELEDLGFGLSYQSLTRNIRARDLRPVCEACRTATRAPERGHRAPTRRRNPVGLAGIAESTRIVEVGQDRQSAGRLASAFGEVAGRVVALNRSTPSGRRDRPCRAWSRVA